MTNTAVAQALSTSPVQPLPGDSPSRTHVVAVCQAVALGQALATTPWYRPWTRRALDAARAHRHTIMAQPLPRTM